MKKTIITIIILALSWTSYAQSIIVEDFKPVCDSLTRLIQERTTVKGALKTKAIMKRGNSLDFYFTESLGDLPWYSEDAKWFRNTLKSLFPEEYRHYKLGEIYSRRVAFNRLVTPHLTYEGQPAESSHRIAKFDNGRPLVRKMDSQKFSKGLDGRNIALWQSHGRYYDQRSERWRWQRPCLFQTCEDMFTQSFIIPYLVPMIENAGGYVLMPRERDIQINEIIADNDTTYNGEGGRFIGRYEENGSWTDAGAGFADTKAIYTGTENPFTLGTSRQCNTISSDSRKTAAKIIWNADVPERGEYAVYVSYKTLPKSTTAAHYTVHHLGGETEFVVNQKMGGSTWIYLGTFEFGKDKEGWVSLTNRTPKGYRSEAGTVVTADAVRFGGGIGNIARQRKSQDGEEYAMSVSGMPRSAEAARYWLQWAGTDPKIYSQNEEEDDYKDDYMSRGDWVTWLSGGSAMNPKQEGKRIPIDLSLGFHSDAGVTPNDSIIGTLAIYTLKSEGIQKLPSGENRMTSREFADIVQSQIVNDIRAQHDSLWSRRQIWDRAYRESRTPSCPSMLLELLSHQNFADMKYGLDPAFRFTVGRAVYKGMLKYLSNRYGHDYVVQPLPVDHVAVEFESGSRVSVSWKPVEDPLEPTAVPEGYIVYRRIGEGGWDKGTVAPYIGVDSGGHLRYYTEIPAVEVVSFKVVAYNDGGMSFPSEIVSIGIPKTNQTDNSVLIVNNFDRISGPAWFDGTDRAGLDNMTDSGIGYISDITFTGQMYNFRRSDNWISNDRPGFGASYSDMAGETIAGNTFDYPALHGKAILQAGHSFYSCSNERFMHDQYIHPDAWAVDLICGKQLTVQLGGSHKYQVFPEDLQKAICGYTSNGGNLIVSGAYIGTDVCDAVYPVEVCDSLRKKSEEFLAKTLGIKYVTSHASRKGTVGKWTGSSSAAQDRMSIAMSPNSRIYCVESVDAIAPAAPSAQTVLRYSDSNLPAGTAFQGEGYRCISFGFPIETLENDQMRYNLISNTLEYLKK